MSRGIRGSRTDRHEGCPPPLAVCAPRLSVLRMVVRRVQWAFDLRNGVREEPGKGRHACPIGGTLIHPGTVSSDGATDFLMHPDAAAGVNKPMPPTVVGADLRVAERSARLGAKFLRVGLHPGMGATLLLPHVVGPARAARLLHTGETLDGERAHALGLLSELAPDAGLVSATEHLAAQLASGAPNAARRMVATLREPLRRSLPAVLAREAECQADDFAGEDVRTAIEAFRRGDKPDFSPR